MSDKKSHKEMSREEKEKKKKKKNQKQKPCLKIEKIETTKEKEKI